MTDDIQTRRVDSGARLTESAQATGTLLCLGIDPRPELIPSALFGERIPESAVLDYCLALLDVVAESGTPPAAFKPNAAFFHQLDRPREDDYSGSRALAETMNRIERLFPGIPVILDAKRGDIATTSTAYAREAFVTWGADAVTVSPFMGDDSVEPFLQEASDRGRWVYILNRTSNAGAARFQERRDETGAALYENVAAAIAEWNREFGSAGAVIGATAPEELRALLSIYRDDPLPILVPGVGAQGGSAETVLTVLQSVGYPGELVRVNASRSVTFPWAADGTVPADWRRQIATAYRRAHESLRWT